MRITAAVATEKGKPFQLRELEISEPRPDEILVRVVATGVCHTDLVVRDQYYPVPLPAVLGHEGAGVVEKVGADVRKVAVGDHVVLTFATCGVCDNCQSGALGYCTDLFGLNFGGRRTDGTSTLADKARPAETVGGSFFGQSSFATYALATERNVVKAPRDVPLEILGPLGCGVQTGAGAVMNALQPKAGSSIAVFGVGSVGLSAVMAAKVVGCTTIIGVDVNDKRLNLARELGATHAVNSGQTDAVEAIREITGGAGAKYSLECTSLPKVLRQAVDCLALTGTCGLVGAAPLGTEVSLDMNTIMFGRTVRGIIEGDSVPDIFIPKLIELYRQGRFPFDRLIEFYDLSDINAAADAQEQGRVLKPVLRCDCGLARKEMRAERVQ